MITSLIGKNGILMKSVLIRCHPALSICGYLKSCAHFGTMRIHSRVLCTINSFSIKGVNSLFLPECYVEKRTILLQLERYNCKCHLKKKNFSTTNVRWYPTDKKEGESPISKDEVKLKEFQEQESLVMSGDSHEGEKQIPQVDKTITKKTVQGNENKNYNPKHKKKRTKKTNVGSKGNISLKDNKESSVSGKLDIVKSDKKPSKSQEVEVNSFDKVNADTMQMNQHTNRLTASRLKGQKSKQLQPDESPRVGMLEKENDKESQERWPVQGNENKNHYPKLEKYGTKKTNVRSKGNISLKNIEKGKLDIVKSDTSPSKSQEVEVNSFDKVNADTMQMNQHTDRLTASRLNGQESKQLQPDESPRVDMLEKENDKERQERWPVQGNENKNHYPKLEKYGTKKTNVRSSENISPKDIKESSVLGKLDIVQSDKKPSSRLTSQESKRVQPDKSPRVNILRMENEKVIQEGFVISDGSLEESKQIKPEHELINSWTVQPNRYSNYRRRWTNYELKARNARKTFMERNYDEAKTFKGKSLDRMKIDHNDVDTTQKDKFQYHSETDLGLKEIYKQILNLTDDGKITLPKSTRKEVESLFRNRPKIKNPYKAVVLQSIHILRKSTDRNPGRGKHSEKIIRNNIHDHFKRGYCTAQRDESSTDKLLGGKVTITQHSKPNLTDDEIEDYFGESQEVDELSLWKPPIELTRGETGVYDIDQLVLLLKEQKAKDICVIRMPSFLHLSDFMVIATGRSPRQSAAIMATVKYMYKQKKSEKDHYPRFERDQNEWLTVDLGNIILHLMSEEVREYYDLETLWTVGQEFEDNSLEEDDRYNLSDSDLDWLKEYDVNSQKNDK